ncbi:MAG TPA: 50S ribosomal protein L18 [Thermoanaerobaculia bacterium]|nr:50S ribosomal protein L18 [Thermoanaerobaculia bacterium]
MTEHLTKAIKKKRERRERAHLRIRTRVRGTSERPRLSVYKSLKYIYAQLIDDDRGHTIAAASSADPDVRQQLDGKAASNKQAAKLVGETIAVRAREKGIEKVVFDRGGYVYHGNVKALADSAREKGLQF